LLDVAHINQPGNGLATLNSSSDASCVKDTFGDGSFRVDAAGIFLEGLAYLSAETTLGSNTVKDL
jgi:hypothetical protein